MSHTSQLQKEIDYWTVMIQKHKNNMKTVNRGEASNSKYSWKRAATSMNNRNASEVQTYTHTRQGAYHKKRHLVDVSSQHSTKKPLNNIRTTSGDQYKSKFKWTKPGTSQTNGSVAPITRTNLDQDVVKKRKQLALNSGTNLNSKVPRTSVPSNPTVQSQYKYIAPSLSKKIPESKLSTQNSSKNPLRWTRTSQIQNSIAKSSHIAKIQPEKWRSHQFSKRKTNPYSLNRTSKRQLKPFKGKMTFQTGSRRFLKHRFQATDKKLTRQLYRNIQKGAHLNQHHITLKQQLANRVVKSHHAAKLKKPEERQHCLYFGRFGKCMRGNDCKFIHDPSRVAVCRRFLRGTCRDENCSFSHKLEKEKTPLCLHFLKGKCTSANCPYLHVYLGKDAPICPEFARTGYCAKADKCEKQHIKCCPEFFETGICTSEKTCKLPHMAKRKLSAKAASRRRKHSSDMEKPSENKQTSTEDFLSLKVDSPILNNKPFQGSKMKIKPMLPVKNKPKER